MQSIHSIGLSGRTLALAAATCPGGGGDKKPRGRRLSKEERKTMVESFITKYQNLNNGKFPSLNLTHKEVGGSFYTVREIVREIIQQNRVLGPGHATSKSLNLEYFPEEQTEESVSIDISTPLSISTINHAVDQQQGESFSLYNESRRTNPEIIKVDEHVNQVYHESQLNVTFVSQNLHDENYHEISNDACLFNKSGDLTWNPNLDKLSGLTDGNSSICEQPHVDVQVYSSENPTKGELPGPSCEAVSLTRSLSESVVNGYGMGDKSISMAMAINLSATSSSLPMTASFSETNSSLDPVSSCSSPCSGENSPVGSSDAKSCNSGESQNIVDVTTSFEAPEPSNSDEVRVAFVPFEKDSVLNMSETIETLTSSVVDKVSAAYPGKQLSLEKDSIINSSDSGKQLLLEKDSIINSSDSIGTLSSIVVDEMSTESFSGSTSQNLDSSALGGTISVAQPLVQANEFRNGITNIESSSEESIQAIKPEPEHVITNIESYPDESIQAIKPEPERAITNIVSSSGESIQAIKLEPELALCNIGSGKNSGSISQDEVSKESELSERNPFWSAIKSLLNAVVKFWME